MIQNPILRGFCPDPSIVRVNEDYYLAVSTFEWWPGVKLYTSKDLKTWKQIPSVLRRESQLNMIGNPTSGGIWAPCLSWDGSKFYLVYTDVKTKKGRYYNTHNYMVYTDDIYGDWSEPVYLNSIGFDPSLFHDQDGKKYLVNMVNGFQGILVQELDPCKWKLIGERKKVYDGSGIGCTEGPHIYHIGDFYYLIVAEGGTGLDHCVTLARAKTIWGPYETAPNNPILTSNQLDPRVKSLHSNMLQKCGHADITDTPDGEWYMVHLCSRPLRGLSWSVLGRETAIQKVHWKEDGWLSLESEGRYAQTLVQEPVVSENGKYWTQKMEQEKQKNWHSTMNAMESRIAGTNFTAEFGFFDNFDHSELDVRYVSPRVAYDTFASCLKRPGYLRIIGKESMNSLHHVSLLAVKQEAVSARAETHMEFNPDYPEQFAGLAYMYDAMNFYLFGKTISKEGQAILSILKSDMGVITDEIVPIALLEEDTIQLCAQTSNDGTVVNFFYYININNNYKNDKTKWQQAGGNYSTQILTDEHCRGFTGAHFGMYVHDMTGLNYHADFDYFSILYQREEE